MQVRVHNPEGRQGELSFCFEASPDTVTSKCPQGYAQLHVSLNHHQKEVTYKVHRQGYLKLNPPLIEGKMKFREDGSIKVMAAEHSNAMSVSLVNAKVYFPGEELADELKESFSTGSVLHWVVFGLIALAVKPMELGISQIVMFKDEEMQVRVRNPQGKLAEVSFCFEAAPDIVNVKCPQGFAQLYVSVNLNQPIVTYYVNRQGRVKHNPGIIVEGKIKFREDGSIKVLVHEQHSTFRVSVVNAEVFIPKEEKSTDSEKRSYKTIYWVILGLALLAIL
uniref:Hydrocephalus-inducing protein homolog n=1 Tax=Panagrellus redivivus TaxID=6233 RepID=A0A7E4WD45_PANRE